MLAKGTLAHPAPIRRAARTPRLAAGLALPTLAALLVMPTGGSSPIGPVQETEFGVVDFANSGSEAVQTFFQRGVAALHNMSYTEAAEAFREAQAVDPSFALAYWGEALTYDHPLWGQQDSTSARAVLGRLAATAAARLGTAPTPREKGLMAAVDVLFGEGEKTARTQAYAEAMGNLHAAYPDDVDIGSLYALALLGSLPPGEDDERLQMEAAAILEALLTDHPRHPGVLHYLIHSYDDPVHAPLGLRAARTYAGVAPAAPHAQHMPSHIFVQLGLWDLVEASNAKAYEVSIAWQERTARPISSRDYHSLFWLLYARLQQGRYRDSEQALESINELARETDAGSIHVHRALMDIHYRIETASSGTLEISDDLPSVVRAAGLLASGLHASRHGDAESAQETASAARRLVETTRGQGSGWSQSVVEIIEREVSGLAFYADGDNEAALEAFEEAARLERELSLPQGPPFPPKPANELYGEILLELGQPNAARVAFERALRRTPNRPRSLMGLAQAAKQSGDTELAAATFERLRQIWAHADEEVAGLSEARNP